ncbi:DUF4249 domain-containing protein [Fibrella aquatica]|jgi:Domain of unknown function (DUF4249)|uniref:DUF4249 domain-containing protein n=1 Tax=Fibrella aquatica TaxID=3242487 RepID=UPI003521169C
MNRNVIRYFIHLLIYGLLASCVTPYQPELKSLGASLLIVDGYMTDQPGPYQVTLSYTSDYSALALNFIVEKATVFVTDDQGKRQDFSEIGKGVYRTPATFQGQQGRTYKLSIILPDGKRYESKPEKINPVPTIDRIYDEYTETPIAGTSTVNKGFNIYLDTKDPASTGDYYRWIWTHFEPLIQCEVRSVTVRNSTVEYGYNCCQSCWDILRCSGPDCSNAISDEQVNGKAISRQFLHRAPYTSTNEYYVEIEQLALTREAYLYYKNIENLTKSNGGIFDVAPVPIRGNMVSVTNPDETVFGYFSVSGAQKMPYVVDRKKGIGEPNFVLLPPLPPSPPIPPCANCVESDYRTRIKPRWWPE